MVMMMVMVMVMVAMMSRVAATMMWAMVFQLNQRHTTHSKFQRRRALYQPRNATSLSKSVRDCRGTHCCRCTQSIAALNPSCHASSDGVRPPLGAGAGAGGSSGVGAGVGVGVGTGTASSFIATASAFAVAFAFANDRKRSKATS